VSDKLDKVLDQLKAAVAPVMTTIEHEVEGDRAAIVIGAKELMVNGEYTGIQTFVDICGDYGILGEALYNELLSAISENRPQLFELFRQVVRSVEEELGLKENEELPESQTIH
jgi:hypothetical protein